MADEQYPLADTGSACRGLTLRHQQPSVMVLGELQRRRAQQLVQYLRPHSQSCSETLLFGMGDRVVSPSVITSKPANGYHFKTGQRTTFRGQVCFYSFAS